MLCTRSGGGRPPAGPAAGPCVVPFPLYGHRTGLTLQEHVSQGQPSGAQQELARKVD